MACAPPDAQSPPAQQPAAVVDIHDVTDQTGITFVHTHGGTGRQYIVETVTAGVALFDYDGDGLEDIYFLNGPPLPLGRKVAVPPRNALYRNLGGFRFADVTDRAGVGNAGYGLGVAVADYDNDGRPDLFVNNFGRNVLYHNNGDGTFTNVTEKAGVAGHGEVGAGACFFDMDGDGNLDLFVSHYVKFTYESNPTRFVGGYQRYPSPLDFPNQPNTLYRNNGDGTFTNVTVESGVGGHAGSGMGIIAADYDNDGNPDIFVCNDAKGNFLFHNDGTGKFEEVALRSGVAYDGYGRSTASMGVNAADYDNDGRIDFFVTDYNAEMPVLFRNLGRGQFEDTSVQSGIGPICMRYIKWGPGFADFDNDGRRDLFIANGHIEPFIEHLDPTTAYRAPKTLLLNAGGGKFTDISSAAGDGVAVRSSGRGLGLGDLDNDGRINVVVLNSQDGPTILRNITKNANHWVQFRLRGVKTNRDGVGARVKVTAGGLTQIDEVHSGRGYQSHFGTRLHFGLGLQQPVQPDRGPLDWRWNQRPGEPGRRPLMDDHRRDRAIAVGWALARQSKIFGYLGSATSAHASDPHRLVRWVNQADKLKVKALNNPPFAPAAAKGGGRGKGKEGGAGSRVSGPSSPMRGRSRSRWRRWSASRCNIPTRARRALRPVACLRTPAWRKPPRAPPAGTKSRQGHGAVLLGQAVAAEVELDLQPQAGKSLVVVEEPAAVLGLTAGVAEPGRQPAELECLDHVPFKILDRRFLAFVFGQHVASRGRTA